MGLTGGVASLEGGNIVVFYYLSASEIWPYMRVGLWWEELYMRVCLWWEELYKRIGLWWEELYKRVGLWWEELY